MTLREIVALLKTIQSNPRDFRAYADDLWRLLMAVVDAIQGGEHVPSYASPALATVRIEDLCDQAIAEAERLEAESPEGYAAAAAEGEAEAIPPVLVPILREILFRALSLLLAR